MDLLESVTAKKPPKRARESKIARKLSHSTVCDSGSPCTLIQNSQKLRHLIVHFLISLKVSEGASQPISASKHVFIASRVEPANESILQANE